MQKNSPHIVAEQFCFCATVFRDISCCVGTAFMFYCCTFSLVHFGMCSVVRSRCSNTGKRYVHARLNTALMGEGARGFFLGTQSASKECDQAVCCVVCVRLCRVC